MSAQERLADQDWAGVVHKGVAGMTPADKGWILAFVILFGIFQISNYLTNIERQVQETARMDRLTDYFNTLEATRAAMEDNRSQEMRRMQEVNKELSQALSRRHEYEGRARHERSLLEEQAETKP